jgi:hypothetical protein
MNQPTQFALVVGEGVCRVEDRVELVKQFPNLPSYSSRADHKEAHINGCSSHRDQQEMQFRWTGHERRQPSREHEAGRLLRVPAG